MPCTKKTVPYTQGPDRFQMMLSLTDGREGMRNPFDFTVVTGNLFYAGTHQAYLNALKRKGNDSWLMTAHVITLPEKLVVKGGYCSLPNLWRGSWKEFIPLKEVTLEVQFPEEPGIEIRIGPSKLDFAASLLSAEDKPARRTDFGLLTGKDINSFELMIDYIERADGTGNNWNFRAQAKLARDQGSNYRIVFGRYSTQFRTGEIYFT